MHLTPEHSGSSPAIQIGSSSVCSLEARRTDINWSNCTKKKKKTQPNCRASNYRPCKQDATKHQKSKTSARWLNTFASGDAQRAEHGESRTALQHLGSCLQAPRKANPAPWHWELQPIPSFPEALVCATIWWQPYASLLHHTTECKFY